MNVIDGAVFYCIDGPLKGRLVASDFRDSEHEGVVYKKSTYAMNHHGVILGCDIAHVGEVTAPLLVAGVWRYMHARPTEGLGLPTVPDFKKREKVALSKPTERQTDES